MSTAFNLERDSRRGGVAPNRHRFNVEAYYKLVDAGVLNEASRVELMEGDLIDMPPIGSQHADAVDRLARMLVKQVPDAITVRVQNPVRLDEHNELQPDLALLRPRELPYAEAHPTPEDVLLLIEVACSSLDYDRGYKIPLYASHGIPEVWLYDLAGSQLEIYQNPASDGYRKILRLQPDDVVAASLLPGVAVDLRELFRKGSRPKPRNGS